MATHDGVCIAVLLLISGCVRSDVAECPTGKLCPAGTQCVIAAGDGSGDEPGDESCVPADALPACRGLAVGDECGPCAGLLECTGPRRWCYASEPGPVCIAPTCGNNFAETPTESCDDGNNTSGDGCAADCRSNETCGNGVIDPVNGEQCDDGNAASHDGCASRCVGERARWVPVSRTVLPRIGTAMAFDARRGRTVMFGGQTGFGMPFKLRDTHEWTGEAWASARPGTGPSGRINHVMAYDDVRGVVVLFGGEGLSDTWEWNGISWSARSFAGPSARGGAAIAFDRSRRKVVLFGGAKAGLQDTWEWDGKTWLQISTATAPPPPADQPVMAYDPVMGRVVLVVDGGTWAFDGTDWMQIVDSRPEAESLGVAFDTRLRKIISFGVAADFKVHVWSLDGSRWTDLGSGGFTQFAFAWAYDTVRGRLVLFGDGAGTVFEVREWNGTVWETRVPVAPDNIIVDSAAVDELRRGRTLMFGGRDSSSTPTNTTWTFDGAAWRQVATTIAPPARIGHAMAYDIERDQVVLFGGTDSAGIALQDTWIWNGTLWMQQSPPAPRPPARTSHSMAYDATRGRVVLFGGATDDNFQSRRLDDTWEWNGTSWSQVTGPGPSDRRGASLAYDWGAGNLLLVGDKTQSSNGIETWTFDGVWTQQPTGLASPSDRYAASLTWNPARGRLILFGGHYDSLSGPPPPPDQPPPTIALDDTWEWDAPSSSWREITVENTPQVRARHIGFMSSQGTNVAHAGWPHLVLTWDSTAPEETCQGRLDGDGDGLAGCADPDCAWRCRPTCPLTTGCAQGPRCGDGMCDPLEDSAVCDVDCGPAPVICGDAICDPNEICIGDCP